MYQSKSVWRSLVIDAQKKVESNTCFAFSFICTKVTIKSSSNHFCSKIVSFLLQFKTILELKKAKKIKCNYEKKWEKEINVNI